MPGFEEPKREKGDFERSPERDVRWDPNVPPETRKSHMEYLKHLSNDLADVSRQLTAGYITGEEAEKRYRHHFRNFMLRIGFKESELKTPDPEKE